MNFNHVFLSISILLILSCLTPSKASSDNTQLENATTHQSMASNPDLGGFDGIWIGELQQQKGENYPFIGKGSLSLFLMITIGDGKVSVSSSNNGVTFTEIKPNEFGAIMHKTNAIIWAQDSSEKGEWVESLNITLTKKDNSSVFAYFVRSVNNFTIDPELYTDTHVGRFFYSYTGTLNLLNQIGETIELDNPELSKALQNLAPK